ncbi:hypothetical protein TNCV_4845391 [Trichonephila clavipes]|uniref:Uncharacterized protein n=1 Tax=Trichonephila clavipes TaxID=2585209 RepID=A0A8X7BMV7_TRICX|nr:hypothetical protein TNCV_4845391 [Trichonephila clavipes]
MLTNLYQELITYGTFADTGLHRQSSGASLKGRNWVSKLPEVIGICLYGAAPKRDPQIPGNVLGLQRCLHIIATVLATLYETKRMVANSACAT